LVFEEEKIARELFHEQHLTCSLDVAVQPALIMCREAGVFTWEDATLVSDKLFEQVDVFEIEGINREINFWLGTRGASFAIGRAAMTAFVRFVWTSFSRHKVLFDFAMQGVPAERWIVFFDLELFRLELFVTRCGVARR
jgi:hypothetical protein